MALTPVSALWTNSNNGGTSTYLFAYMSVSDLGAAKDTGSSLQTFDTGAAFVTTLYDDVSYTGQSISFRFPQQISNLSDYGFNDKTASMKSDTAPAVYAILYRDANASGRSLYVPIGRIPSLSGTAVGNDAVSSVWLAPRTRIFLMKDINYNGDFETLENPSYTAGFVGNVTHNDQASSVIVVQM